MTSRSTPSVSLRESVSAGPVTVPENVLKALKAVPRDLRITHRRRVVAHLLSLVAWQMWLALLIYVCALGALATLPLPRFHHRPSRVDENALLPGQTSKYFSTMDAHRIQVLLDELEPLIPYPPTFQGSSSDRASFIGHLNGLDLDSLPPDGELTFWLREKLQSTSLDVASQLFSYVAPDTSLPIVASNIYGVMRAPRADGSEAILLTFPVVTHDGHLNRDGIAFAIALAEFVSKFSHWSKDIIFLFPARNTIGTHAFMQAYHGIPSTGVEHSQTNTHTDRQMRRPTSVRKSTKSDTISSFFFGKTDRSSRTDSKQATSARDSENPSKKHDFNLRYSPLRKFSGVIGQGITIELLGAGEYTSFSLFMEGLNGQLPNADAVLTVFKILSFEGFPIMLHDTPTRQATSDIRQQYISNANSLVEFIARQSTGIPRFAHAMCIPFHVEALTIRGNFDKDSWPRMRMLQVGKAVESSLRSFNNLLERLHHSYWFYFMAGPNAYITMSVYLPSVIALALPLLMHAYYLWAYRPNTNPNEYIGQYQSVLVRPNPMLNAMPRKPIPIQGTPFYARPENVIHFSPVFRPLFVPFVTLGLVYYVGLMAIYWTPFVEKLVFSGWLHPFIASALGGILFVISGMFGLPLMQNVLAISSFSLVNSDEVANTDKLKDAFIDPLKTIEKLAESTGEGLGDSDSDDIRSDELDEESGDDKSDETDDNLYHTDESDSETQNFLHPSSQPVSRPPSEQRDNNNHVRTQSLPLHQPIAKPPLLNDHIPSNGISLASTPDSLGLRRSPLHLETLANFDPELPDPPAPMDKIADWVILKCFVCVIHAATLITVAMLNPALAIVVSVPSVPAFLFASPLRIRDTLNGKYPRLGYAKKIALSPTTSTVRTSITPRPPIEPQLESPRKLTSPGLTVQTGHLNQLINANEQARKVEENQKRGIFSFEVRDESVQDLAALAVNSAMAVEDDQGTMFPAFKGVYEPEIRNNVRRQSLLGTSDSEARKIIDASLNPGNRNGARILSPPLLSFDNQSIASPISPARRATLHAISQRPQKYLLRIKLVPLVLLTRDLLKVFLLVVSNPVLVLAITVIIGKFCSWILPGFILENFKSPFVDYANSIGMYNPKSNGINGGLLEGSLFSKCLSLFWLLPVNFPGIVETWRLFGGWIYPYLMCIYFPLNIALFVVLGMDPEDYNEEDSDIIDAGDPLVLYNR